MAENVKSNNVQIFISFIIVISVFVLLYYLFKLLILGETFINLMFDDGLRHTRNMSYDLRGDPVIIPKEEMVWNNSELSPIYNPGI